VIVDASALVAILLGEAGHQNLVQRMERAAIVAVGAHALLETAMVLTRHVGRDPRPLINDFLRHAGIEVVPL